MDTPLNLKHSCKVTTEIMNRNNVNSMECSVLSNRNSDLLKLTLNLRIHGTTNSLKL